MNITVDLIYSSNDRQSTKNGKKRMDWYTNIFKKKKKKNVDLCEEVISLVSLLQHLHFLVQLYLDTNFYCSCLILFCAAIVAMSFVDLLAYSYLEFVMLLILSSVARDCCFLPSMLRTFLLIEFFLRASRTPIFEYSEDDEECYEWEGL